jgi:hypothetical protein
MENYFYRTNNIINGKFYYGSHGGKNTRSYYGSGVAINNAIRKYGIKNFEVIILKRFETRDEAYYFEKKFLKIYKISSLLNSYNIKDDSLGGDTFTNNINKEAIRINQSIAQNKRFESDIERLKTNPFKDVSNERLIELKSIWSKASKGKLNGRARKIIVYGKLYYTIDEAAEDLNLTRQQVKYRLKTKKFIDFKYSCDG